MPNGTRHINDNETLVITDDTITRMVRAKIQGTSPSGRPWSRWYTSEQQIFSWKSGFLNRYKRVHLNKGRGFAMMNETAKPYSGFQGDYFDIALSEKMGVELDSGYSGTFGREVFRQSYPLTRHNVNWSLPTQGVASLLRAPDYREGIKRMFGRGRYSDRLEQAVISASLSRIAFVAQFRGAVKDEMLIEALDNSGYVVDAGQTPTAKLRVLRKLIVDQNPRTREKLLMAPSSGIMSALAWYELALAKNPDWYPRGTVEGWRPLQAQAQAYSEGKPWPPRKFTDSVPVTWVGAINETAPVAFNIGNVQEWTWTPTPTATPMVSVYPDIQVI